MIFDEDVRSFEDQRADLVRMSAGRASGPASGKDNCDGRAVAVAEKNGLLDFELAEEFGKNDLGFVVHEID